MLLFVFQLAFVTEALAVEDDLCQLSTCHNNEDLSRVKEYCWRRNETIRGSCCVSHDGFITGLNLANCSLSSANVMFTVPSATASFNISFLHVLELEGNNLTSCNSSLTEGMSNLVFLSLPSDCDCPGGSYAWSTTKQAYGTNCESPRDLCLETECNNRSMCVMNSPGVPWCVCREGYYGYKCLRQGHFDAVTMAVASAGSTVVLGVGLWFLIRRSTISF